MAWFVTNNDLRRDHLRLSEKLDELSRDIGDVSGNLTKVAVNLFQLHLTIKDLKQTVQTQGQQIDALQTGVTTFMSHISEKVDEIVAEVSELKTVIGSAIALLDQLADLVEASKDDPAQLTEVIAQIRSSRQSLADSVVANTPVVPPPVPEP